jgi:hypothetical protein
MPPAHDEVIKDTKAVRLSGSTNWLVADGDDLYVGTDRSVSDEANLYTLSEGDRLTRTSSSWVISEGTTYLRKVIRPVPYLGDLADVEAQDAEAGDVLAVAEDGTWELTQLPDGEAGWSLPREVETVTFEEEEDTYDLSASDAGKVLLLSSADAQIVSIGEDATFEEGQEAIVIQNGEGDLSFAAADEVVVNSGPGLEALGIYAVITVLCVGEGEFVLHGDLTSTEEV